MRSVAWVVVVVVASTGGFLGGRWFGARRTSSTDRIADLGTVARDRVAAPTIDDPSRVSVSAATSPTSPAPTLAVQTSPWTRVMQDQPDAALATHQAVLAVMEHRRQAIRWRECVPKGSGVGRSALRFDVEIEVRGDRLVVGDAGNGMVEDGVALDPAALQCVAQQLAGHDDVPRASGFPDYRGPVPYRFPVDFGSPD
jgi:hypothetical protein